MGIVSLKNHGIIEVEERKVTAYHYENIIKLWGDTKGPKILELFSENQNELTVTQISKLLKASFDNTNDEIHKMENSGLLEARMIGKNTRVFYLPESLGFSREKDVAVLPHKIKYAIYSDYAEQPEIDMNINSNYIKNKPDLRNGINSLKESGEIIFTDKPSPENPAINPFSKEQIG